MSVKKLSILTAFLLLFLFLFTGRKIIEVQLSLREVITSRVWISIKFIKFH